MATESALEILDKQIAQLQRHRQRARGLALGAMVVFLALVPFLGLELLALAFILGFLVESVANARVEDLRTVRKALEADEPVSAPASAPSG